WARQRLFADRSGNIEVERIRFGSRDGDFQIGVDVVLRRYTIRGRRPAGTGQSAHFVRWMLRSRSDAYPVSARHEALQAWNGVLAAGNRRAGFRYDVRFAGMERQELNGTGFQRRTLERDLAGNLLTIAGFIAAAGK